MAISAADLKVTLRTDGKDRVKSDLAEVDGAVEKAGRSGSRFGGVMNTAFGVAGGIGMTLLTGGLFDMAGGFLMANANAETFRNQLNVAVGDTQKAGVIYQDMLNFAAKTPFEFPELIQGAANLEALGQSSQLWMPVIADTSAATNKSIDQTVQAVLDAQTGEFERLKEFGIRTSVEGDKVKFTFMQNGQEMVVEAENTSEGISNALMGIWDQKYDGAMEVMSNTFMGKLSTLKDNVGLLMQEMTKPIFDFAKDGLSAANLFFDKFDALRDYVGPFKAATKAMSAVIQTYFGKKAAAVFDGIIENLEAFVGLVKDITDAFRDLAGPHLQSILAGLGGIVALFAAMAAWGGLVSVITGIGAAIAFLLSPLGLLIAAAALLGVAWQQNWGDIQGRTAQVVDWFMSDALPRIQQFASGVGDAIQNIWNTIGPVITLLGELTRFLGSEFFVPALDWARFILPLVWDQILDWEGWAAFVVLLDWADYVKEVVWDDYIENFTWAGLLTDLDWDTIVPALIWADEIADLLWPDFIPALTWGDVIEGIVWAAFIGPLQWNAFILKVSWHNFISVLRWLEFVPKLTWAQITTMLWWTDFVPDVVWDEWIPSLDWKMFFPAFAWADWLAKIDWGEVVADLSWSDFIPAISWGEFITAKLSSWSEWVSDVSWSDFIDHLSWPSPGDIIDAIVAAATGSSESSGAEQNTAGTFNLANLPPSSMDVGAIGQLQGIGMMGSAYIELVTIAQNAAKAMSDFSSSTGVANIAAQTARPSIEGLSDTFTRVETGAAPAATSARTFGSAVAQTIPQLLSFRTTGLTVVQGFQQMAQGAVSGMATFRAAVTAGMAAAVAAVRSGVAAMVAAANTGRGQMMSAGLGIGAALGQGIASGIRSQLGNVVAAATAVVATAVAAAKAAGGISSPSKVMRDQVGAMLGAGVERGIYDSIPGVERAGSHLVPSLSGSFAGSGGRSGVNVTVNVPTTINLPDKVSDAELLRIFGVYAKAQELATRTALQAQGVAA